MADAPTIEAKDRAAWRRWLSRHHARDGGVWLVLHKKGSTTGSLSYEDAVNEALCFGWIDSKARTLDDERYTIWMSPRKRGSVWAVTNKRRIERLIEEGAMTEAGMAVIEAAKADGSWSAYDAVEALELPDDLLAAFGRRPGSRERWDAFPESVRKQALWWIVSAKREATRAARVEETAARAARNERVTDRPAKG
ncbi:MAG TPA: YdeI/OmpD-associated family protein [Actinomycetota bacterium]